MNQADCSLDSHNFNVLPPGRRMPGYRLHKGYFYYTHNDVISGAMVSHVQLSNTRRPQDAMYEYMNVETPGMSGHTRGLPNMLPFRPIEFHIKDAHS